MSAAKKRTVTPREELMAKIDVAARSLATNVEYSCNSVKLDAVIAFCEPLFKRAKDLPVDARVDDSALLEIRQQFDVFLPDHG